MLQMEADFHSPSFRSMRYSVHSSKRPRSPEVGGNNPLDRPSKRPLLTVASEIVNMPSTLGCHFAAGKFGDKSRYPSDDWVRQTDHLSIESPVIPDTNPIWGVGGKLPLQDDDVNMDSEEGTTNHGHRPQVASMSSAQTPFSFHPSERRLRHSSSTSTMIPPAGPSVNVLPSCPAPPSVPYFEPRPPCPSTRPSSPVSSSSMMVLSSLPSYVNVAASSPRRQQRFTMGPRADCEKCRLGIKGHWVHY